MAKQVRYRPSSWVVMVVCQGVVEGNLGIGTPHRLIQRAAERIRFGHGQQGVAEALLASGPRQGGIQAVGQQCHPRLGISVPTPGDRMEQVKGIDKLWEILINPQWELCEWLSPFLSTPLLHHVASRCASRHRLPCLYCLNAHCAPLIAVSQGAQRRLKASGGSSWQGVRQAVSAASGPSSCLAGREWVATNALWCSRFAVEPCGV